MDSPPESGGVTVAKAGSIMVASLFLSRVLGLLRDTVMAKQFGIGLDTDAYRLAVTIPDTIFFLIAGGGLSSAFIPVFSELLHKDREKDAWRVFSVVTTLSAILVSVLIAVAWVFAPQIAAFMAAGKTVELANGQHVPIGPETTDKIVLMSRIMLPAQFAFMVGSVLLATLYARRRFVAPGVAPNIYNVGIIVGAFLGPTLGIGIAGMSWGALVGAAIGNLVIPVLVMLRLGGHFTPSIDFKLDGVRKFFRLLLPVILGFSLPSVAALITQKFASIYEEGTNTVITLANNLMQAPLGIFGQSLALAAFPVLTQFFATGRMDAYRHQVSRTLRTVLFLAVPSAVFLAALAPQTVHLIYGYGKTSPDQLARTAVALQVFAVGIPAWCVQPVLMRGFFSIHQTLRPVLIGTVMTAIFIAMCWAAKFTSFGYLALPWAMNVCAIVLAVGLYYALEREVGGELERFGLFKTLTKSLVGGAVMGGLAFGLFQVLPWANKIALFVCYLGVALAAAWAYYFVCRALNMPETEYLARAMARLDRRKAAKP